MPSPSVLRTSSITASHGRWVVSGWMFAHFDAGVRAHPTYRTTTMLSRRLPEGPTSMLGTDSSRPKQTEMENHSSHSDQIYQPPTWIATSFMPDEIRDFLNGDDLERKLSQAVRISTVSEDGWPHAAMLSAGEMLALDAFEVAMLLYDGSNTSRNLARGGRLTLPLPLDHGLCEMRLRDSEETARATPLLHCVGGGCAAASVPLCRCRFGVTFRLHDPTSVLARWSRQIETLRGLK